MSAWVTNHDANYSKYQSGLVTNLQAGSNPGSLQSLPPADINVKKPQKIMVQAHPLNAGYIVIGQNLPLNEDLTNGGFCLAPGEMQVLPDNTISVWRVRGSGTGGQALIYTYLTGAN